MYTAEVIYSELLCWMLHKCVSSSCKQQWQVLVQYNSCSMAAQTV
jgi:hypothetical protein